MNHPTYYVDLTHESWFMHFIFKKSNLLVDG